METRRFLEVWRLMNENQSTYMKAGALFFSYRLMRAHVIDSFLAAFHITAKIFPNVEDLFYLDELFRQLMALINRKNYSQAKFLSAQQLKHVKFDHKLKVIDFYGTVYDHFPLFDKLVCAEMIYNETNESAIYEEIFSQFKSFGYVKALGDAADPALILGYCLTTEPVLYIKDKKKRIFQLQFLLLGKEEHMTMCFRFSMNNWKLYDNDQAKPSFQDFNLKDLRYSEICLAGYVNLTQAQTYKFGIAETREGAGAMPFYSGTNSSPLDPDLLTYPVAIPETGQGLGPRPFYSNWPDIPPISDQEQPVEDQPVED
ncbi:hypothetical protein KOW79_005732 [Hemibagrus wyckioides]|uniref:Uncharacterized protein n=1 Tax=Hemibagrus wyckioides TaxID=337641 RepID=A0A9D3NZC9_9TELE|nr:uncharacterized protein LOC131354788 [Hemibagrus wyckioides]XP_058248803.1 uncharacterized protein LOC131354788 [Hemibagrus wyckioides]KAG7331763.1 hypothetical protein KOW79_005732 [Hemibagrus wyckioides]